MKEDGGYEVREHRKDDAVSASTLPIGELDIWKRGYLSLFVRPHMSRNYPNPNIVKRIMVKRMKL